MAECELLSVEEQLKSENKELRKQIEILIADIEQGFMKGAYARLKELQEMEKKLLEMKME